MPTYEYVSNRILSPFENLKMHTAMPEGPGINEIGLKGGSCNRDSKVVGVSACAVLGEAAPSRTQLSRVPRRALETTFSADLFRSSADYLLCSADLFPCSAT